MYLNNILVPNASKVKLEWFKVTNMERLGNGDMAGDEINRKRKLYLTYDKVTGYELDLILDACYNNAPLFFPVKVPYNGTEVEFTAYVGSIPAELYRAGQSSNWVWTGVAFNLIER